LNEPLAPDFAAHPRLAAVIDRARARPPLRTAIAYPLSAESLGAALAACACGLIDPVLVGPRAQIEAVAGAAGLSLTACAWVDTADDPALAARTAVALIRGGDAGAVMKGSLHTEDVLRAVIARHDGLRIPGRLRRLSHVFWVDVPAFPRPLLLTDCVVNIDPSLATKRDIIQNAFDFAHLLGYALPRLAVVSATENQNAAIRSTADALALKAMALRGEITGGDVDGPFGLDIALSAEAARIKGVDSPVAGTADILLLPGLEAGNIAYKALVYAAGALCAGVVLGTSAPVILTSRADTAASRVASCALACIQAAAAAAARA